jgi:hypothetical protein
MSKVLYCWMLSVFLGSLFMPLFFGEFFSLGMSFFCSIVAAAFTIPMIIIELVAWNFFRKRNKNRAWQQYSLWKYSAAILTLVFLFFDKMDFFLPVVGSYGVLGLLLHFFYLKKLLNAQLTSGDLDTFYEED